MCPLACLSHGAAPHLQHAGSHMRAWCSLLLRRWLLLHLLLRLLVHLCVHAVVLLHLLQRHRTAGGRGRGGCGRGGRAIGCGQGDCGRGLRLHRRGRCLRLGHSGLLGCRLLQVLLGRRLLVLRLLHGGRGVRQGLRGRLHRRGSGLQRCQGLGACGHRLGGACGLLVVRQHELQARSATRRRRVGITQGWAWQRPRGHGRVQLSSEATGGKDKGRHMAHNRVSRCLSENGGGHESFPRNTLPPLDGLVPPAAQVLMAPCVLCRPR